MLPARLTRRLPSLFASGFAASSITTSIARAVDRSRPCRRSQHEEHPVRTELRDRDVRGLRAGCQPRRGGADEAPGYLWARLSWRQLVRNTIDLDLRHGSGVPEDC